MAVLSRLRRLDAGIIYLTLSQTSYPFTSAAVIPRPVAAPDSNIPSSAVVPESSSDNLTLAGEKPDDPSSIKAIANILYYAPGFDTWSGREAYEKAFGNGDFSFDPNAPLKFFDAPYSPSLEGFPRLMISGVNVAEPTNSDLTSRQVGGVPGPAMSWFGVIGGMIGVFSATYTYTRKFTDMIVKAMIGRPHHNNRPHSWEVAIQVGLSTIHATTEKGLWSPGGDFPQVCLFDANARLLGYTDQRIEIRQIDMWKNKKSNDDGGHKKWRLKRPEGMPRIKDGGWNAVGVWPTPDRVEVGTQQAAYITLIKRHYDAVCISNVAVTWPDHSMWEFDGSWARASDQAWFYSHIYDPDNASKAGECFWLDHRGSLDHTQDRKEEYIHQNIDRIGPKGVKGASAGIAKNNFPSWLWASDNVAAPDQGLPFGDDLTEGMRRNGVDKGRVPLGVKVFLPAFKVASYQNASSVKVEDFTRNPAKLNWIMENMDQNKDHPALPIMHPEDDFTDPGARRIMGGLPLPVIGPDCLTDFYHGTDGKLHTPAEANRCIYKSSAGPTRSCLSRKKVDKFNHSWKKRDLDDGEDEYEVDVDWDEIEDEDDPEMQDDEEEVEVPLHKRWERSLVMDSHARSNTGASDLCTHDHSVGPSYANFFERQYCRMTDKTLWPFCDQSNAVHTNCFDEGAEVLHVEGAPLAKRETHWDSIEHWGPDGKFKRDLEGSGELIESP